MRSEEDIRAKVRELNDRIQRLEKEIEERGIDEPNGMMLRSDIRDAQDVRRVLLWVLGETERPYV
ncbi:MAG: hypothetical protein M1358_00965 [Chloroflexi bacterium]|nr:hypothetical protein [Chloroflexota bacterium]